MTLTTVIARISEGVGALLGRVGAEEHADRATDSSLGSGFGLAQQ
jgi:hypothetical protein